MQINEQQKDWLIKELETMLDEQISGKCIRSQFSILTIQNLLAKLKEE